MIRVVCNSSPIIGLSIIGKLHLLWEIFEQVFIPNEVYNEVVQDNQLKNIGEKELRRAVNTGKIQIYKIKNPEFVEALYGRLHRGELEVIAAAKELNIERVILDDKSARNFAETMLLKPIGIIGDQVGIHFANLLAMPEGEELPFENKEELEAWLVTIQEQVRELFKAYLAEYDFSLEQIRDLGQKSISLPNGNKVETTHIQVELSVLDLLNMVHYSLNHFVEDEEFQTAFFDMIVALTLLEEGKAAAELSEAEVAEMKATLRDEINPAVKNMAVELRKFIDEELSAHEQVILDAASFFIDTYIGVNDQEIYQQDYRLDLTYTEELSKLNLEETEDVPFIPGDSVSFTMSQQIWNHNQKLDPIAVPGKLITVEEIEAMKSIDEFKQVAGEDSLLAQIAEQFMGFMGDVAGDFGYVELKVDEHALETMAGTEDVRLYIKDGQLMAPLAVVSEAMGADVAWDEASRQIAVNTAEHTAQVDTANEYTVLVDGVTNTDIMVEIVDGTSYVNIRDFAEAMGWTVLWMEETRSALIMQ